MVREVRVLDAFSGTWGSPHVRSVAAWHHAAPGSYVQLRPTSFSGDSKVPLGSGDWIGMQALDTQPRRGPVFPLVIPIKPPPGKLPAPGEKEVGDTRMELYSSNLESGNLDVFGMKKPMLANETALVQSSRAKPYGGGGGAEAMHNLLSMAPSALASPAAPSSGPACQWDQVVDDKAEVAMWETLEHAVSNRLRAAQPASLLVVKGGSQSLEGLACTYCYRPPTRRKARVSCHSFL
mmetsp:Transcript_73298/g.136992  ORF Transcript_73298/g.136992 Transcript_73298/m.136992 type:complete len:236 (+) Transcript_73298:122-829(+)